MRQKLKMVFSVTFLDEGASLALLGTVLNLTDVTKHKITSGRLENVLGTETIAVERESVYASSLAIV